MPDWERLRVHCTLGGVERPRRKVRFARLIQRRGRDLGGPSARAAFGGNVAPDLVATQRGVAARLAGVGRAITTLDSSTSLGWPLVCIGPTAAAGEVGADPGPM